jgi:ankyrin repeat protein
MELLLCCAYVDLKSDPGGNTPVHLAAMNSHSYVIELLLRFSADPAVPNDQGLIPVELAKDAATKEALLRRRGCKSFIINMLIYIWNLLSIVGYLFFSSTIRQGAFGVW